MPKFLVKDEQNIRSLMAELIRDGVFQKVKKRKQEEKNEENIKKLPIRVNVNGIRGKSTATRLITGVLDSAGYKVVGKTTGTSARMIYWNKEDEEVIQRNGLGANIKEQIDVVDKARKAGSESLV